MPIRRGTYVRYLTFFFNLGLKEPVEATPVTLQRRASSATAGRNHRVGEAPEVPVRMVQGITEAGRRPDYRVSEETLKALNARLLTQLIESIEQAGAVPLTVLLPRPGDALPREILLRSSIRSLDVSECLSEIPDHQQMVRSGNHYTGVANQAIARCTAPAVKRALKKCHRPSRCSAPRR